MSIFGGAINTKEVAPTALTSYVPIISTVGTLANLTTSNILGRYVLLPGKLVYVYVTFQVTGISGGDATTSFVFSLPFPASPIGLGSSVFTGLYLLGASNKMIFDSVVQNGVVQHTAGVRDSTYSSVNTTGLFTLSGFYNKR